MNLTWHIIKKDLSRFRLAISIWALAGTIVLVLNVNRVWMEAFGGSVGQMIMTFSSVAFFLLGIALLGWFVQEDNVAAPGAFWQSRPISGGRLLAAKASIAFVLLVFIPMLASDACAQGHLASMQTWGAFGRHLFVLTALTAYGMAMAAATRENGAFILGCVAATGVFLATAPIDLLLNHRGLLRPAAQFASVAVIGGGGLAGLLNQYLRRKTKLTFAVLGATIMIAVLAWELWPRSDPNAIPMGKMESSTMSTTTTRDQLPADYRPPHVDGAPVLDRVPWPVGGWKAVTDRMVLPNRQIPEAKIELEFTVTSSGEVTNVRVTKGIAPDVDQAVLTALRQSPFEPGIRDGKKTDVKLHQHMIVGR
jgi:TonB family protein